MSPHFHPCRVLLSALCLFLAAGCDSLEAPDSSPSSGQPLLRVELGMSGSAKTGLYATSVVSAVQGQAVPVRPIAADRSDPAAALGAPDAAFFSLGFDRIATAPLEGELVLDFGAPYQLNGLALTVFEETYGTRAAREAADVYMSDAPAGPWQFIGTARNDGSTANTRASTSDVSDLCVRYVRLVDRTNRSQFTGSRTGDGFDVNAVRIEHEGTCGETFSISGMVYADADADASLDAIESGIQNVVVQLQSGATVAYATTTSAGAFSFDVPAGTYTLSVPATAAGHFNAMLYNTHISTAPQPQRTVTTGPSLTGADFGFELQVAKVTIDLETGTIEAKGKDVVFWEWQLWQAILQDTAGVDVPASLLSQHLIQIEHLLLPVPFQFGPSDYYRFRLAYNLLGGPIQNDVGLFQRELLAAELNVVSGRGSDVPAFDRALLAYGESVAAGLSAPLVIRPDALSKTTVTLAEATALLRAFNSSGGGGSVGGPR